MNTITRRSSVVRSTLKTIYSFAVIIEPCDLTSGFERLCLTAYFCEPPFAFEIDEWAQALTGNNYRVVDSFPLEELNF